MMKRSVVLLVVLVLMVSVVFAGCGAKGSASDDSWKKIQDKGVFVLGMDEAFPPMGFKDETGKLTGFDVDVATEVCKRLGLELKLQPIDWNAKENELNTGNIDCIWNGFTITEERKQNVLFSSPYMNNRQVLVVKAGSSLSKLEDFKGKKLALQGGSSAALALDSAKDFKDGLGAVVELEDNMMALMDLQQGGVDVVLMDEIVARYYVEVKGEGYTVLDEALAVEEYGIGFRKNDKALMEKFDETLKAMAKDGKLAEISTKWFGKDLTTIGK